MTTDEGWTQQVVPSYGDQQKALDAERAAHPYHDMTGPGYTEPEIAWDPPASAEYEADSGILSTVEQDAARQLAQRTGHPVLVMDVQAEPEAG